MELRKHVSCRVELEVLNAAPCDEELLLDCARRRAGTKVHVTCEGGSYALQADFGQSLGAAKDLLNLAARLATED